MFFQTWIDDLRDVRAVARIAKHIDRLALGNPGDVKSAGGGGSEMRIDHGPGHGIDFTAQGKQIVILLCGGDTSSQERDIRAAKALAKALRSKLNQLN
ncbi:type II toxin-antitoxin system RelE/ParE family toxin [Methylobacterium sp. AMS5]|uniref:type II toxin-antitoxin system RelE/ParE family toxin n=1 Tax=Methylobacterium sp. AMS5 TaxID=925818 RepID=UPI000A66CCD9|nr:type II toxin-antitoxin system RelE/ParE family toxin [Methylobacterium sp. AMS5]